MKLGLIICLTMMLTIPIYYVDAQNPCYGCGVHTLNSTDLQEAQQKVMQEQIKSLGDQHTQDLQIMCLLIALIVGLGSGVITLTVILYKNRKWNSKNTN